MACFILQIQSFLLSVCPTIGPLLQPVLHVSCAVAESPPPLSEQNERWCDCGGRAVSNRGETCSAEAASLQIHCEMAYSQITISLNDWFDDSNQSFNDNSFFFDDWRLFDSISKSLHQSQVSSAEYGSRVLVIFWHFILRCFQSQNFYQCYIHFQLFSPNNVKLNNNA